MAASRPSSSIVGSLSVHSSNKQGASPLLLSSRPPLPFVISTAPSFCHLDRPFLLSSRPPLPFVISTKRSAWRDLSTTLEMTKVLHLISLSPCLPVSLFCDRFCTPSPPLSQKGACVACFPREIEEKTWNEPYFHRIFASSIRQNKF